MKSYPDQLEALYCNWMERLADGDYPEEYRNVLKEFTALCKEIEAAFPKEKGRQFTDELDSVFGSFASIHQEFGWKKGFKSAYKLSMAVFIESA